jgi:hypothetical protein
MVFFFTQTRAAARSRARASSRVLRAAATTAMRASCSWCAIAATAAATAVLSSFLLVAAAVCCPSMLERLELLSGIIDKTVVRGGDEPWRALGLDQR